MLHLLRPSNMFIFLIVVVLSIISLYWIEGYHQAKKQDENLPFLEYIKTDTQKIKQALKTLPDMMKDAVKNENQIKIGSLNKIAQALEMYQIEYGYYPKEITDLLGTYINKKTKIFQEKSFYYRSRNGGYEMGISLSNGEVYKIEN